MPLGIKLRVFIATTEGPAEVQRISEEDPAVQSVICLDGQAIALPVSAAYEAFVRRPTGLIEAAYGHPAFRLDVAQPVTEGLSWQLGVLVAHGLAAAGRLAGRTDAASAAVWLTGEVDLDHRVRPVAHLREKLKSSGRLLSELAAAGMPVSLYAPQESLAALAPDWLAGLGLADAQRRILPVASAEEVFADLGLPPPKAQCKSAKRPKARPPARRIGLIAGGAVAAAGLALAAFMARELPREPVPAAVAAVAQLGLTDAPIASSIELRARDGSSCAAVRMGVAAPERRVRRLPPSGELISQADALCALHYEIANHDRPRALWLLAARGGSGADSLDTTTLLEARPLAAGESVAVEVRLPHRLSEPLVQHLALISAEPGAADIEAHLAKVTEGLERRLSPADWRTLVDRLALSGLPVTEFHHALTP